MLGRLPAVKNRWGNGGVQMMSIHKSKGLEFPIVFLCDLEHAFSRQDFDTPVLVHPALGLGPLCIDLKRKIRYPTMARLALEEKLRRENLAEEQRILYVAMTRPKEKLILVDALYGAEKRLQKLTAAAACPVMPEVVAEGKCFGDWILLPLLCRPEAAPLRDMAGVMAGGLYTGDTAPWQVFIHDGDDFGWAPGAAVSDTEKDAGETLFDPALLTFRYPYQRETTLPAKLTATQLKGPGAGSGDCGGRLPHALYPAPCSAEIPPGEKRTDTGGAGHRHPSCLAVSGSAKFGCARTGGKAAAGSQADGGAGGGCGRSRLRRFLGIPAG